MTKQELKTIVISRAVCASKHWKTAIMFAAFTAFMVGCEMPRERSATSPTNRANQDRSTAAQDRNERAQERTAATQNRDVQADNTRMNAGDRDGSAPTADQALNNLSDRETMQLIRQSIVDDESLSVYGKNVKVIAQNGHVTLNGTVHTQAEKSNIGAKATEVAGRANVTNKINVKE